MRTNECGRRNSAQRGIENIKILVIDDTLSVSSGVAWVLIHQGYLVRVARNLREAETVLADFQPELIILDIRMAHAGGAHLCRMIRDRPEYGVAPVIMLAGPSDADAIKCAIAAGCDDYITRPVSDEKLLLVVETHLARGGVL